MKLFFMISNLTVFQSLHAKIKDWTSKQPPLLLVPWLLGPSSGSYEWNC
jgi:hypothetical protein